ncbi:MAG TPA: SatD family protein [Solirubrobacterales bacterium]|jgi:hypothetical protein
MAFTLIGDIVASRQVDDRALLQERLAEVLRRSNTELRPKVRFEPTIGDEFQACFYSVAQAVRASLLVRLDLLRTAGVDSRYGLGVGDVEVFSRSPLSQDGPGWWAAREAMESSRWLAQRSQTAFVRTYFEAHRPLRSRWGARRRL